MTERRASSVVALSHDIFAPTKVMGVRGLASALLASLAVTLPVLALECTECAISRALLPGSGAKVNYVKQVPLNGSFTGSANDTLSPSAYTGLPSLCAISINVPSSASTSFNFGVFMPDTWNGRFITTGNGGFGGGVNWVGYPSRMNLSYIMSGLIVWLGGYGCVFTLWHGLHVHRHGPYKLCL